MRLNQEVSDHAEDTLWSSGRSELSTIRGITPRDAATHRKILIIITVLIRASAKAAGEKLMGKAQAGLPCSSPAPTPASPPELLCFEVDDIFLESLIVGEKP